MSHIDKEATNKMISYENSYAEAMAKLDCYYGEKRKVIQACVTEIRKHPSMAVFDYKGLVSLKTCLVNYQKRLQACDL